MKGTGALPTSTTSSSTSSKLRRAKSVNEKPKRQCTMLHLKLDSAGQLRRQRSMSSFDEDNAIPPPPELLNRRRALIPEDRMLEELIGSEPSSYDMSGRESVVILAENIDIPSNSNRFTNRAHTFEDTKRKQGWVVRKLYEWSQRAKTIEAFRQVHRALSKLDHEFDDETLQSYLNTKCSSICGDSWTELPVNEQRRVHAVWELFHTELYFLYKRLLVLRNVYREPLKNCQVEGYLVNINPHLLFGNIEDLCSVSFAFCKRFLRLLLQSSIEGTFASNETVIRGFDIYSCKTSPISAYQAYCINYQAMLDYLETVRKSDDRFVEFEKICMQDTRCGRLQLQDLLIAPLHRITRLPLLLKEILRHEKKNELSEISQKNREELQKIILLIEEALRSMDSSIQWLHNFERLQEIQSQLIWPTVSDIDPKCYIPNYMKLALSKQFCERLLAHPRRKLIHEGYLLMLENQKEVEMYAFMFNDMLLLTKLKQFGRTKKIIGKKCDKPASVYKYVAYRQPVPLDSCVFCDVSPEDAAASNLRHAFVILHLTRFCQVIAVYTLQASTKDAKKLWINKFQESIEKYESIQLKDVLKCTPILCNDKLSVYGGETASSGRSSPNAYISPIAPSK